MCISYVDRLSGPAHTRRLPGKIVAAPKGQHAYIVLRIPLQGRPGLPWTYAAHLNSTRNQVSTGRI